MYTNWSLGILSVDITSHNLLCELRIHDYCCSIVDDTNHINYIYEGVSTVVKT